MQNIEALFGYVAIRRDVKDRSAGGIIIPDQAKDRKPAAGEVVSVGPGKWDAGTFVKPTLKPGDRVLVNVYAGFDIDLEGGMRLLLVPESSVLARLPEKSDQQARIKRA